MTTPTIADVRTSLAKAITIGTGLRSIPYLASTIAHPCAHINPSPYDPRMVLGKSKAQYDFVVTVFVGATSDRGAQVRCDELREPSGTGSLVAAIEDGDLWVADVDYAQVTMVGEPTQVVIAEETLMMFEVNVEVVF